MRFSLQLVVLYI